MSLAERVEVLRDSQDESLTFRFAGEMSETLVFRRRELEAATSEVMAENGIPKRGTDDVMALWNARGATA